MGIVNIYETSAARARSYLQKLKLYWHTWDAFFLTRDRNPHIATLFVLPIFSPGGISRDELGVMSELQHVADLRAVPCDIKTDSQPVNSKSSDPEPGFENVHCFQTRRHSRLVLVSFFRHPHPSSFPQKIFRVGKASWGPEYIYGNNWHVDSMFKMPVLRYFEVFFKVDIDIYFKKMFPDLLSLLAIGTKGGAAGSLSRQHQSSIRWRSWLHTEFYIEPTWVFKGLQAWRRDLLQNATRNPCSHTYTISDHKNLAKVFYGNFQGGPFYLWDAPEVRQVASSWLAWPDGQWQHRWGDQQWWKVVHDMFETSGNVVDASNLRGVRSFFTHKGRGDVTWRV